MLFVQCTTWAVESIPSQLDYQLRSRHGCGDGVRPAARVPGEMIQIGDNVTITIVRIGPNTVRLGIDAPRDVPVVRDELQPQEADAGLTHKTTVDTSTIPTVA